MTAPLSSGWRPSHALHRAVLLVTLACTAAVVTGRGDLVALIAPLVAGTVLAAGGGPPRTEPRVRVHVPGVAHQDDVLRVEVDVDGGPGAETAVVRLPAGAAVPHGRTLAAALDDGRSRLLSATARPSSWGRVTVARPDLLVASADGLFLHGPTPATERRTRVLPSAERVRPVAVPPRPAGFLGSHRTRRPGEGSDLLDVREFVVGDRLRRIDWRVTARTGRLHVRRTAVDADADVVLCLDTRADLSPQVERWPSPPGPGPRGAVVPGSSLDVAVRAAAALAAAHLRHGDRVAVVDLTRPRASVPPGSGQRQLLRIRSRLADVGVHSDARRLVLRTSAVPLSATVVVLSPLLDDAVADLVASLRRRRGEVVALDVLPAPLTPPPEGTAALALRLVLAEREERLARLRRRGVLVQRWEPATFAAAMVRLERSRGRSRS